MDLQLPSGFVAQVSPPPLRALLSGLSLVEASLATPDLSPEALSDEDRYRIETWAARHLADDPEAAALAEICSVFCCRPSRELKVPDPIVAFALDNALVGLLVPGGTREADDGDSETRVRFTTGGPE